MTYADNGTGCPPGRTGVADSGGPRPCRLYDGLVEQVTQKGQGVQVAQAALGFLMPRLFLVRQNIVETVQ